MIDIGTNKTEDTNSEEFDEEPIYPFDRCRLDCRVCSSNDDCSDKTVYLSALDVAAISKTIKFEWFSTYNLSNQHLISVTLDLDSKINGTADATPKAV